MKYNDDILLESAYEKILEHNQNIEDDQESLFNRYNQEFKNVLSNCKTVNSASLDYDIDDNGELFFYVPSLTFYSDINIDRDMDIESQINRGYTTIQNFIDKNPELKNVIDLKEVSVSHSRDDRFDEDETTGTENEWIGISITTKEDITLKEDDFKRFLVIIKFIDTFLVNLITYPQVRKV